MASRSRTPGHAQALYKVPPYSQHSRSCPVEIYIHIYIYIGICSWATPPARGSPTTTATMRVDDMDMSTSEVKMQFRTIERQSPAAASASRDRSTPAGQLASPSQVPPCRLAALLGCPPKLHQPSRCRVGELHLPPPRKQSAPDLVSARPIPLPLLLLLLSPALILLASTRHSLYTSSLLATTLHFPFLWRFGGK